MTLLALESATDLVGVALIDAQGVVASASLCRKRRHAEALVPLIDSTCKRAEIELADIDAVGVDIGPGLFTGLRVAIATAKALGFALGVPLVPVTSLEVLAFAYLDSVSGTEPQAAGDETAGGEATGGETTGDETTGGEVTAVVDARRGEVFHARYGRVQGGVVALEEGRLSSPSELAGALRCLPAPRALVGNGAIRYHELFASLPHTRIAGGHLAFPPPEALARVSLTKMVDHGGVAPDKVAPHYMREADVRINWERRVGRLGD